MRQPCRFVRRHTGADSAVFELVAPCDSHGSTYYGKVLFLPVLPGGLLPCATTSSLCVTLRSNMDEVPFPMAGRGHRPNPNRTRARCLFMGELQRGTSLPAPNVLVVLLRQRRTYEGARALRCGASPPSPSIRFGVNPERLGPDGPPAYRLSRLVSVCVCRVVVPSGSRRS